MTKVIIDTNLWISFLIGHKMQLVRQLLTDLRFEVYVCNQLIEEIVSVAKRNKIAKLVAPSDVEDLLSIIFAYCQSIDISVETPQDVIRDPKDLYLLSLAETISADYIISGDADLTIIGEYKQAKITTLTDFKMQMGL